MTLSQQSAILLEAVEHDLLRVDGVVHWADSAIVAAEKPAPWLIELSTMNPLHITGFVSLLHAHAANMLPLHWRVQIIVLAYDSGLLSVRSSLPKLFRVLILETKGAKRDSLDERLCDALVEWDCQEDLDVIEPSLYAKFEALFREYLANANEVSEVLRWKHQALN